MQVWRNAKMDLVFYDRRTPIVRRTCEVRLSPGIVTVLCRFIDRLVALNGLRDGQGHYRLASADRSIDATLHRFKEGRIMEGSWRRKGERGFWRITLGDRPVVLTVIRRDTARGREALLRPKRRRPVPGIAA